MVAGLVVRWALINATWNYFLCACKKKEIKSCIKKFKHNSMKYTVLAKEIKIERMVARLVARCALIKTQRFVI